MSEHRRRVLLVEPPFHRLFKDTYSLDRYPLGLGYLAGSIRKNTSWEVSVFNADFGGATEILRVGYLVGAGFSRYVATLADPGAPIWREVRAAIDDFRPDVVGISSKSQNYASAMRVARIAKESRPGVTVIVGGPHPSAQARATLTCPDIDVAVRGEGETTVVELLRAIERGTPLDGILGIAYRGPEGTRENAPREPIADLDALPFPHETAPEVLAHHARYPISAFRYVMATRGCPYDCIYCGSREVWTRRVRFRSPANVVAEIEGLRGIGVRLVHFSDDTFGVTRRHLLDLCGAMTRHCAGLRWSGETHANLIDDETVRAMRRSGCHAIEIGIESGSDDMLRRIRKHVTSARALAACDLARRNGIEVVALFMAGFPDETEDSLLATLHAIRAVNCDRIHFGVFTPYPGTEAFEICRSRGMIGDDYDPALFGHQSPNNYFCPGIRPERFREIVAEMTRLVDRRNVAGRFRRLFTGTGLERLRELGFRRGVSHAARFFFGR